MKAAPHEAKAALAEDLAGHQREMGRIPNTPTIDQLAKETLERIDREPSRPRRKAKRASLAEKRAEKQGGKLLRGEALGAKKFVLTDPKQIALWAAARARINLLMSKRERDILGRPSWHERIVAATYRFIKHRAAGVPELRNPGRAQLLAILEESERLFGPWRKAPG